MFERDHIMRQINMLSQAIARALSLRAESRETEAMEELDRALDALAGSVEPERQEASDIFQRCIDGEGNVMPFAYDAASILTMKGDSLIESGLTEKALEYYVEALRIYKAAVRNPSGGIPWDIRERMDGLEERLQDAGGI